MVITFEVFYTEAHCNQGEKKQIRTKHRHWGRHLLQKGNKALKLNPPDNFYSFKRQTTAQRIKFIIIIIIIRQIVETRHSFVAQIIILS
jgi:hypothetical protein